jgi:uncharacterized protein
VREFFARRASLQGSLFFLPFPRGARPPIFAPVNLVKARSKLLLLHAPLLAAALLFASCQEKQAVAPEANEPKTNQVPQAPQPASAGQPQPKLRTVKLWLGSHEIIAEIAHSPKEVQTGMMFRTSIAESEGMLFVFDYPHRASFYMKNTLVPLSCAYIDAEGIIVETHDMFPHVETPITAGSDKIQYVLEVKQGWFQRNGVGAGALLRTEKGTLRETFYGR